MRAAGDPGAELVPGVTYAAFLSAAGEHRSEVSFRASAFYRDHGAALERLLLTPRIGRPEAGGQTPLVPAAAATAPAPDAVPAPGAVPAPDAVPAPVAKAVPAPAPVASAPEADGGIGRVRVLHWNIEKGRQLAGIIRRLREDPWMRRADLILLNEVDSGTARGGQVDQAAVLADALGMHHAWLPAYIECTKGTGLDLLAEGENRLGLHGLAILSRWPVLAARAAALPSCHDYFGFHEKRYGGRRGLYALLGAGERRFVAATTHLEVRNTPRCRARQMAAFLRGLREAIEVWNASPGDGGHGPVPVILGGDWNTNTFRRGTVLRSAREFVRLVTTPEDEMARQLAWPCPREPLFALLAAEGFAVERCNQPEPTAGQMLGGVEDMTALPGFVAKRLVRAFHLSERTLWMRLDWIAVRGWQAEGSGVTPPAVTLPAADADGCELSDHVAIGAEVVLE